MSSITIGSTNCRGIFSDKIKRRDIFQRCRGQYDISVLIDTHSTKNVENQWHTKWGYDPYFSSYASNSRGVAILFKNPFEFKVNRDIKDKNGNFIILDITVGDYRFTLVAVYGPNEDNPEFFSNLYSNIILCENTSIISVGDWNVVQNYEKNTLNYVN
jgi:exonuclease III